MVFWLLNIGPNMSRFMAARNDWALTHIVVPTNVSWLQNVKVDARILLSIGGVLAIIVLFLSKR